MKMAYINHKASMKCFCLIAAICFTVGALFAQFGGGQGTEQDPWQIGRPDHLSEINNYLGEEHNDKYYIQTQDIDLDVEPYNEGQGWVPIGRDMTDNSFQGNYNGNGFTIDNLFLNRTNVTRQGLFGCTNGAVITNVTLTNVDITGSSTTGSLIGLAHDATIVDNCWSSGDVRGIGTVGGLVAHLQVNSVLRNSFTSCNVTATNDLIGGLIGSMAGGATATNNYATGNVTGRNQVGGLVGRMWHSFVDNCYSRGQVTGGNNVGGLTGQTRGNSEIDFSYNAGRVTGDQTGGFLGHNNDNCPIRNCYWDTEVTGQAESAGGEGRMTRQMVHPYDLNTTYTEWDFDDIWRNDAAGTANDGYPILHFQDVPELIDSPEINVELVEVEGVTNVKITWERVEEALSYRVYSSLEVLSDDWGEPIATLGGEVTEFVEAVDVMKFYYVTASPQEARDGRNNSPGNRRRGSEVRTIRYFDQYAADLKGELDEVEGVIIRIVE